MKISGKKVNRLALDSFLNRMSNSITLQKLGLKELNKKELFTEVDTFYYENLHESDAYNNIDIYEAYKEIVEKIDLDPVDVWDLWESVREYITETEVMVESGENIENQIEIENPKMDLKTEELNGWEPDIDLENWQEDEGEARTAVSRHLI